MTGGSLFDWPFLFYLGTVVLHMSEQEFWKCTPRKLFALTDVHVKLNSPEKQKKEKPKERLTIKELMSWR